MRKLFHSFLIALLIVCSLPCYAGRKLKVLFIGNSYTFVNNLPQVVASVASAAGDTLIYDSYAIGGYTFADHAYDPLCIQKIQSADWDVVVLQEQSEMPAMPTSTFFTDSYHYAYVLDTTIEHSNPCAEKMFYMTWGRKNGDASLCSQLPTWPYPCTYEGMDSLLHLRYQAYADTALPPAMGYPLVPGSWFSPIRPSELSPVGAVWHYIRDQYPGIELYQTDESHPSEAGSYAAACTFYAALFRNDPTLTTYNYSLSAADADHIKQAAKLLVFDSLQNWNIGYDELRAQFTTQVTGGNTVLFSNNSSGTTTFQWDLGDGTTTASGTVFHTYSTVGSYTVRLIASNGSCSDTCYAIVTTNATSAGSLKPLPFLLSPNPAHEVVRIQAPEGNTSYDLRITDLTGRILQSRQSLKGDQAIDISSLPRGVYLLQFVSDGGGGRCEKIVKE